MMGDLTASRPTATWMIFAPANTDCNELHCRYCRLPVRLFTTCLWHGWGAKTPRGLMSSAENFPKAGRSSQIGGMAANASRASHELAMPWQKDLNLSMHSVFCFEGAPGTRMDRQVSGDTEP